MAFAECPTPDKQLHTATNLFPDLAIFESSTRSPAKSWADGQDGELVSRRCRRSPAACSATAPAIACAAASTGNRARTAAATVPRISSDLTRESSLKDLQLLKVKGTLVNLEDCAMILSGIAEIEEWQIELRRRTTTRWKSTS